MIETDQDNFSELRKATVTDVSMIDGKGTFKAMLHNINKEVNVSYASPYASPATAGIIAIPEEQTEILICRPSGSKEWIYIASTFNFPMEYTSDEQGEVSNAPATNQSDPSFEKPSLSKGESYQELINNENVEPANKGESKSNFEKVEGNKTSVSNTSDKILIKGKNGQGIEISDTKNGTTINDIKTEINSSNKKKITLHDSPAIDSIKLDSGNDATITLTQNPDRPGTNAGSIEIDSKGPLINVCRESEMELRVLGGGRELNIINHANGVPWGKIAGVPEPNPIATVGNVNIQSDRGDINLFAASPYTGRIFIETLAPNGARQFIKIGTAGPDGSIVLQANSIVLDATGAGTIDLNAPGGVYINGGAGGVHTTGARIETQATNGVNIDPGGGEVNLAGGSAAVPNTSRYVENTSMTDIYKIDDYFGLGVI